MPVQQAVQPSPSVPQHSSPTPAEEWEVPPSTPALRPQPPSPTSPMVSVSISVSKSITPVLQPRPHHGVSSGRTTPTQPIPGTTFVGTTSSGMRYTYSEKGALKGRYGSVPLATTTQIIGCTSGVSTSTGRFTAMSGTSTPFSIGTIKVC